MTRHIYGKHPSTFATNLYKSFRIIHLRRTDSCRFLALAALILLPVLASGQSVSATGEQLTKAKERVDFFQLLNGCRPMVLAVEGVGDAATKIGLTTERIRTMVEARLRAARLYTEDWGETGIVGGAFIYVNIGVFSNAYSIRLGYNKTVSDKTSWLGGDGMAETWNIDGLGTHGKDARFILSVLSEFLDKFIAEYLRVNEPHCK